MHESVRKCLFTIHLKEKILLSHALFRSYLQKNGAEIGDQHYFIRIPICSPTAAYNGQIYWSNGISIFWAPMHLP